MNNDYNNQQPQQPQYQPPMQPMQPGKSLANRIACYGYLLFGYMVAFLGRNHWLGLGYRRRYLRLQG